MREKTKIIHAGEPSVQTGDPVIQPIYQSTMFVHGSETNYREIQYLRLNNTPNHVTLNKKIAELEGTERAMVTGSGMAAISTALLALIPPGKKLLAQTCLYGGTAHFLRGVFLNFGRKVEFFDERNLSSLVDYVDADTVGIYVEPVSNPLVQVTELGDIVDFAKTRNLKSFIDNTLMSPINFRPRDIGFDVVLHSASKYLNGHSDLVAGSIAANEQDIEDVTNLLAVLGACLDPHACYLLNRGLKTLGVRVRQQNETALLLAERLSSHPKVKKVNYPGLSESPDYERAKRYFKAAGGVLSFEYAGSPEEADTVMRKLKLARIAPSLGGVESLVTRPVTTSHASLNKQQLKELGIADTLVRISVGLEDPEDLIEDFWEALA